MDKAASRIRLPKGVLLEGKTSPFTMQKGSFFTELCKWLIFKGYFNGNQSLSLN